MPIFLDIVRFHEASSSKKQGNAPNACKTHKSVDDAADGSCLTAEEPGNQIKSEQTDQTPVQRTDDAQNQRNGIHFIHPPVIELSIVWTAFCSLYAKKVGKFVKKHKGKMLGKSSKMEYNIKYQAVAII